MVFLPGADPHLPSLSIGASQATHLSHSHRAYNRQGGAVRHLELHVVEWCIACIHGYPAYMDDMVPNTSTQSKVGGAGRVVVRVCGCAWGREVAYVRPTHILIVGIQVARGCHAG